MSDPTNKDRADRIPPTLAAYRRAQNGGPFPADEADIRDMLTDLMHYCTLKGIDFAQELGSATGNYEHELFISTNKHEANQGEPVLQPCPEPTLDFFQDILCTALEAGISDWAIAREVARDEHGDYLSCVVYDWNEDAKPGTGVHVDVPFLRMAIARIISDPNISIVDKVRGDIWAAYQEGDAGQIDAFLADVILQIAVFGEIRYC